MQKFESAITDANNYPVPVIDNREVFITYAYGELEPLETQVEIDISSVNWSQIKLDPSCELEVICICEKQRVHKSLGTFDINDPSTLVRSFSFNRDSETTPFFLVNIYKPSQDLYVAISHRVAGSLYNTDEEGLFNWEPFQGDYAWDVGFISDKGPTIFINQEKLSLMQDWLLNEKLLWQSLIIPTCMRQCITLYFQHRNDSGGENESWTEKYETLIKELGFEIEESLFSNDIEKESEQKEKAEEITNRYCELNGTIQNIKSIMGKEVSPND